MDSSLATFRRELEDCLNNNILRYWIDRMTDPRGGFYGRRDGYDRLDAEAEKGGILNARILWSFAAAYRHNGKPEYADAALRAEIIYATISSTRSMVEHIGVLMPTAIQ